VVRIDAEISVIMGGLSIDFGGQYSFFPDGQTIQKINSGA
jgi:hypothetical protein